MIKFGFKDYVTKGEVYEVVAVEGDDIGFKIINDKKAICFPLLASFKPHKK